MSLLDHSLSPFDLWLDDMSDRLNPFVVRDVRVWLKGRWLPIVLLLQVAVTWYVTLEIVSGAGSSTDTAGRHLFFVLSRLTILTTTIPIPVYLCLNLTQEVRGDCLETLWLTPCSGRRIVAGKLLTSLLSYTLHLSVFLPFLTVAILFGGVGALDVFSFLLANSLAVLVLCFGAMALGACARHRLVVAVVLCVIGLPTLFFVIAIVWFAGGQLDASAILFVLLLFAGPIGWGAARCLVSPPIAHLSWEFRVPAHGGLQSSLNLTLRTRFRISDSSSSGAKVSKPS